jgi:hypothetical protein
MDNYKKKIILFNILLFTEDTKMQTIHHEAFDTILIQSNYNCC